MLLASASHRDSGFGNYPFPECFIFETINTWSCLNQDLAVSQPLKCVLRDGAIHSCAQTKRLRDKFKRLGTVEIFIPLRDKLQH